MYGVVLATVMTVGAGSAPAWTCHGCHGCWGCWGCHGCHGCHGYAFTTYGCCGGCSGCWGCYGCSGCCGGCYGGYYYSYGNCYGCYGGCTGCWGCYGGSGCYGPTVAYYPTTQIVVEKRVGGGSAEAIEKENRMLRDQLELLQKQLEMLKKKTGTEQASSVSSAAPASLTVTLPADAKLYIDNTVCPLTSGKRSFNTPNLEPGRQYYYVLRAEVVRNGQVMAQSQKVLVQAGGQVNVEFSNFAPAVATTQR